MVYQHGNVTTDTGSSVKYWEMTEFLWQRYKGNGCSFTVYEKKKRFKHQTTALLESSDDAFKNMSHNSFIHNNCRIYISLFFPIPSFFLPISRGKRGHWSRSPPIWPLAKWRPQNTRSAPCCSLSAPFLCFSEQHCGTLNKWLIWQHRNSSSTCWNIYPAPNGGLLANKYKSNILYFTLDTAKCNCYLNLEQINV